MLYPITKLVQRIITPNAPDKKEIPIFNSPSECIHKILESRDIINADNSFNKDEYLENIYSLNKLLHFESIKDIVIASKIISNALLLNDKIVIVGDYDCDGATATALCFDSLCAMGADRQNLKFIVPDRFNFGYGLSLELLKYIIESFSPKLIITVDSGSSNIEAILYAKKIGIKVVVTDHHQVDEGFISPADAFVNPRRYDCNFESKNIAGVGVIFYVILALRNYLKRDFINDIQAIYTDTDTDILTRANYISSQASKINMASYLDLVAIGTVADLVYLDSNNQILVQQGLARIRKSKDILNSKNDQNNRKGVLSIIESLNMTIENTQASDISFKIAPKLNSAGRLDDMTISILCLLSKSMDESRQYYKELFSLNSERQAIEVDLFEEAMELSYKLLSSYGHTALSPKKYSLVLYNKDWHQGLIGIIAGKLKEIYAIPVFVFTDDKDGLIKGSARGIEGMNIRDIVFEISLKIPNTIQKFGGHAMAAGLSIKKDDIDLFSETIENLINSKIKYLKDIGVPIAQKIINYDFPLPLKKEFFEIDFIKKLLLNYPWGVGIPKPSFRNKFCVAYSKVLKDKFLKFSLKINKALYIEAVWFSIPYDKLNYFNQSVGRYIDIVYELSINSYNGINYPQLVIIHAEMALE